MDKDCIESTLMGMCALWWDLLPCKEANEFTSRFCSSKIIQPKIHSAVQIAVLSVGLQKGTAGQSLLSSFHGVYHLQRKANINSTSM